jgi:hypothetical protein
VVAVRIGTWNLEGRWTAAHGRLLDERADLWLLTEVALLGAPWNVVRSGPMRRDKSYAAIASRDPLVPVTSPHVATAAANWNNVRLVSSVLPWRSAGGLDWPGDGQADRTSAALQALRKVLTANSVWGGDWNHELAGRLWAGSVGGRDALRDLLGVLNLQVLTEDLPARAGSAAIDHIAVPACWCPAVPVRLDARGLSDHDAYVVEVFERPS